MLLPQRERPRIVTLVRAESVARAIERAADGRPVVACHTVRQFETALRQAEIGLVVYETGFDGRGPHPEITSLIANAPCPVLLTVRGEGGPPKDVLDVVRGSHEHVEYVVGFPEDVQHAVRRICARKNEVSAVPAILGKILTWLPPDLHDAVVHAAVLSSGYANVELLRSALGVSLTTLETRFRKHGLATPITWVGALRAATSIHRYVDLRWNIDKICRVGGFPDRPALAHCVKKATSHSLKYWRTVAGPAPGLAACAKRCRERVA